MGASDSTSSPRPSLCSHARFYLVQARSLRKNDECGRHGPARCASTANVRMTTVTKRLGKSYARTAIGSDKAVFIKCLTPRDTKIMDGSASEKCASIRPGAAGK
jgi:hypothetical protein